MCIRDRRQTGPVTMPMFLFDDDPDLRKGYFWCAEMVSRGVYMHPFHNMFISNALTMDDIEQTLAAADGAFEDVYKRQALPGRLEQPHNPALGGGRITAMAGFNHRRTPPGNRIL